MLNDRVIGIAVTVALFEMMAAFGLSISARDLLATIRRWPLAVGALVANYLLVPAITIALLMAFRAQPMVAAGFVIVAVCPGAPFAPSIAAFAKGDAGAAVGLMVALAASSAVLAPLLLRGLLPLVSGSATLAVDARQLLGVLLVSQIIPLCLGLVLHAWRPALAARLRGPAVALSRVLIGAAAVLVLAAHFRVLAQISVRGYTGMGLLAIASLAAGWIAGGAEIAMRRTLAITTSLRNVGVALAIATSAFAGTAAGTAVVAYFFVELVAALLAAAWWGRHPIVSPHAIPVATHG